MRWRAGARRTAASRHSFRQSVPTTAAPIRRTRSPDDLRAACRRRSGHPRPGRHRDRALSPSQSASASSTSADLDSEEFELKEQKPLLKTQSGHDSSGRRSNDCYFPGLHHDMSQESRPPCLGKQIILFIHPLSEQKITGFDKVIV
ncbi:hypothetical protein U9M48_010062 [Paspalum notatum var. saurae]|uniref:Uncharacterized protein n=1 Tax=Paspalum notatum var. saurae TaxID=547442 RepID=A0AAQ3SSM1_PASNO